MKEVKTNNGISIPIVGSGTNTFGKKGNSYNGDLDGDTKEMAWAIENGYRHFDSAQIYHNEEIVGNALAESNLPRSDFFLVTKLNTYEGFQGRDWAEKEIEKSLEKLQTDYIDLLLIHFPWDNEKEIVEAWQVLEDYYRQGTFKAIGVSNFEKEHLDLILENSDVVPAVNQIESHVGKWNDELIEYNRKNNILTTAWSPLAGIEGSKLEVLEEIGKPYDKSAAQVVLRYQVERDVIVIPKSHDKEHQAESLDIFDFELSQQEREQIQSL